MMSETENQELLLDIALRERIGGEMPPDMRSVVRARINTAGQPPASLEKQAKEKTQAEKVEALAQSARLSIADAQRRRAQRWVTWGTSLAAASLVAGFVLMSISPPSDLPKLRPTDSGNVENGAGAAVPVSLPQGITHLGEAIEAHAVGATIVVDKGMLLVSGNAPAFVAGTQRIESSAGRVVLEVAGVGVPNAELMDKRIQASGVELNERERANMLNVKNWISAASLSFCVLSGAVIVNGTTYQAQEREGEEAKAELAAKLTKVWNELNAAKVTIASAEENLRKCQKSAEECKEVAVKQHREATKNRKLGLPEEAQKCEDSAKIAESEAVKYTDKCKELSDVIEGQKARMEELNRQLAEMVREAGDDDDNDAGDNDDEDEDNEHKKSGGA